MKLLAVKKNHLLFIMVSQLGKTFWEENLTPANMTSFGCHNFGKQRDIKNDENYIIFDISSNIDCMEKREVTSS